MVVVEFFAHSYCHDAGVMPFYEEDVKHPTAIPGAGTSIT